MTTQPSDPTVQAAVSGLTTIGYVKNDIIYYVLLIASIGIICWALYLYFQGQPSPVLPTRINTTTSLYNATLNILTVTYVYNNVTYNATIPNLPSSGTWNNNNITIYINPMIPSLPSLYDTPMTQTSTSPTTVLIVGIVGVGLSQLLKYLMDTYPLFNTFIGLNTIARL